MKIAFLTDPHLPLPPVSPRDLLGKPLTGFLNWQRRKERHDINHLFATIADITNHKPDVIVVGGDLVNLALQTEAERALILLEQLESLTKVMFLPGNHDAYTSEGEVIMKRVLSRYWGSYPQTFTSKTTTMICLSTAFPTPPLNATGQLGEKQLEALTQILREHKDKKRIIALHHPPLAIEGGQGQKRLLDAHPFLNILLNDGVELVLHGHTHRNSHHEFRHIPVIGTASSSATSKAHDPASWTLIDNGKVTRRIYESGKFKTRELIAAI